jgi:hypothetical protein
MVKGKKSQKKKIKKESKLLKGKQKPKKSRKVEVLPPLQGLTGPPSKNLPAIFDNMTMDGTSITQISMMHNENYAPQIIQKIMTPNRVKELLAIKTRGDVPGFLNEGKKCIIDICRGIDSLAVHTSMFVVLAMIQIGRILDEIFIALGNNRSKYAKWVKGNFGSQHTRYFQQSRQLLSMGSFATKYSSLGKNRLLQVDRIQGKDQYEEIIMQHPYPDITQDKQGTVFNEHTDAAVTLYNLKQGGIDFADFDQAYLLSCCNKHWIEQKTIKKIKGWLDKFPTLETKKEAFENYVMNKMVFPSDSTYQPVGNVQSLNAILSNLILYYENHIEGQAEWRNGVDRSTFEHAKNIMSILVKVTIPEKIENAVEKSPQIASPAIEKKKQPVRSKGKEVKQ